MSVLICFLQEKQWQWCCYDNPISYSVQETKYKFSNTICSYFPSSYSAAIPADHVWVPGLFGHRCYLMELYTGYLFRSKTEFWQF